MHHQCCFGNTEPRTAVFLGHSDSQPSAVCNRAVEFLRKVAAIVALEPVIVIEFTADFLYRIAYGFLVRCQRKIHQSLLPCSFSRVDSGHLATAYLAGQALLTSASRLPFTIRSRYGIIG